MISFSLKVIICLGLIMLISTLVGCKHEEVGTPGAQTKTQLSAQETQALIQAKKDDPNFIIVDVRTPREYQAGHIDGAINIDFYNPSFASQLEQLDRDKEYLIYCRSGNRSGKTYQLMTQKLGFQKVYHLTKGMIDWNRENLPLVR
ncbi:MAG: rhodanese-like domain-containing protein [Gemmatimonadetes bacterium]|nr:MAG: rhodanese-like domain-containing protein [Gemmatimonadota bacterium]